LPRLDSKINCNKKVIYLSSVPKIHNFTKLTLKTENNMLATLYPYIYLTMIASAMIWYMLDHKKSKTAFAKIVFLGSAALYLPTVFFTDGSLLYKAMIVPRDLGIMALAVIVTNSLLNKPKVLFTLIIGLLAGVNFFYMGVLKSTFTFNENLNQEAELMFDIRNERQLDKIKTDLADYDLEIERAFPDLEYDSYSDLDEFYTVNIPGEYADKLDEIIEALNATNAIDFIDENEIIRLEPSEVQDIEAKKGSKEYGINDPSVGQLWGFQQMDVAGFYKMLRNGDVKPKKKARVAILDTGIDSDHEDLKGNYKSTDKRYDSDVQGHGTHCAGIAGAVSNNGKGIASLALNGEFVEITSIKVLSDQGVGSQKGIINGIIKAADRGADVISMSLGGPSFGRRHKAYEEAIKYAQKSGAIVVVAAGNDNEDANKHVPAVCKGVITVSAVDNSLNRANFSNYISSLDMGIAAPGVNIYSTFPNNKYASLNGTSMATPYVAGLLGIMKSINPKLTTEEAYKILKETGANTKDTAKTGKFIQPKKVLDRMK
jgi:thermitase